MSEAPIVTRVALSGESGVQVTDVDPAIVIWGRPGRDDNVIVAVREDGTIDPHPDGVIVQVAEGASDPFWPR